VPQPSWRVERREGEKSEIGVRWGTKIFQFGANEAIDPKGGDCHGGTKLGVGEGRNHQGIREI